MTASLTRAHRLSVARAWEGDEPFSEFMQRWVETGEAKASAMKRVRLNKLAQLVADAELVGAAAQQRLITNTLFGGLIEGPLVDEAIALSQRVNVSNKQACAVAWDEGFQDRQQPTNPYLPAAPKPSERP